MDLVFYFKTYILGGLFIKYIKIVPRQMFAVFYPIIYLLFSFLFSIGSAYFLFDVTIEYFPFLVALISSMFLMYVGLYFSVILGKRLAVFWVLRTIVFLSKYVLEDMKIIEERIDFFSRYIFQSIQKAQKNEIDEVLIVAHSVGTILMIPMLSKVLQKLEKSSAPLPIISVLVLGECIPLVTGIPSSTLYQKHMTYVANSTNINWLDFTTVIDGVCCPTLNYFNDKNIKIKNPEKFHFLSARFHTLFSKTRYASLRKNRYLTHFAYLMSTEFAGAYDFFKMTAGENTLNHYFPRHKKETS